MNEIIEISKTQLANLIRNNLSLAILECGRVDKWIGYYNALNEITIDGVSYNEIQNMDDEELIKFYYENRNQ